MRVLLSLLAAISPATSLSTSLAAQCAAPVGTQTVSTFFTTTTVLANPNILPSNGPAIDPGVSLRFDLTVTSAVLVDAIGANLWNDGTVVQFGGIPLPPPMTFTNLIGGPNGTMEVYVVPNDTVTNPLNYGAGTYTINPLTGPGPAWTPVATLNGLNGGQSVAGNLAYSAVGTPTLGTFSPPLAFAPGVYAVEVVLIPPSTAAGTPNTAEHQHPLMSNLNIVPVGASHGDQFLRIDNAGANYQAFAPTSTWVGGVTPYLPSIDIRYGQASPNVAYSTPHGSGCHDGQRTFYEAFAPVAVPGGGSIDLAGGSIQFSLPGPSYHVTHSAVTFPRNGIVPGSTTHYTAATGTPTHVNGPLVPPATSLWGDWDDATSVVYTLPFFFPYPVDVAGGYGVTNKLIIGSNGSVWLGTDQPAFPRFALPGADDYVHWTAGPPSFAVAYTDLYPSDGFSSTGGTGEIYCDSDGSTYVTVSWVNCREYPNDPVNFATGVDFQITLEPNGDVTFTYGHTANGNSGLLVGFTPGNNAIDPGSGATGSSTRRQPDLSMATTQPGGYLSGTGGRPAVLGLSERPRVGAPLSFLTTNVDTSVGANLVALSLASIPRGLDLGPVLGMSGCNSYLNAPLVPTSYLAFGTGPFVQVATPAIPPGLAGMNVYAQAVQFSTRVPPFNAPNLLVSNALCVHFDNN